MMCSGSATLLTLRLRTRLGKKILGTNSPMKSHKTNKKAFLIKEKRRHIKIFQGWKTWKFSLAHSHLQGSFQYCWSEISDQKFLLWKKSTWSRPGQVGKPIGMCQYSLSGGIKPLVKQKSRPAFLPLLLLCLVNPHPMTLFLLIFIEWREGERKIDVSETHWLVAFHMHPDWGQGLNKQPRYVPLAGNKTHDPSGCRIML